MERSGPQSTNSVTPKTAELMLKALQMSQTKAKQQKLASQRRERNILMTAAAVVGINLVAMAMIISGDNSGMVYASAQPRVTATDSTSVAAQELASERLRSIARGVKNEVEPSTDSSQIKSKLTPVFDLNVNATAEAETYYGEELTLEAIRQSEAEGRVPHSADLGQSIGQLRQN